MGFALLDAIVNAVHAKKPVVQRELIFFVHACDKDDLVCGLEMEGGDRVGRVLERGGGYFNEGEVGGEEWDGPIDVDLLDKEHDAGGLNVVNVFVDVVGAVKELPVGIDAGGGNKVQVGGVGAENVAGLVDFVEVAFDAELAEDEEAAGVNGGCSGVTPCHFFVEAFVTEFHL